jgi:undecaprenyl-diphosphatase
MISILQAIILGLLQGAAELFPISSLGHGVILPRLLGWNIRENDNGFLVFLIATHLATAIVLIFFYRKTWAKIIKGILRSLKQREISPDDKDAKLGWLLVAGTIPAGLIGVLFQDQLRLIFVTASSAALFLILNGFVLLGAEYIKRRRNDQAVNTAPHEHLADVTWAQSIKIGVAQTIALIPGFSRSGAAMSGGLLSGLNHEDAANYAFLLATPIILAAAVLKLPELVSPQNHALILPSVIGGLCAALTAFIAVKYLTRYFEKYSLKPFGVYCIVFGTLCSLLFAFGR